MSKKTKIWLLVGLGLAVIIALIVWYVKSKSTPVVAPEGSEVWGVQNSVDQEIKALVAEKMNAIKENEEWYNKIKKNSLAQGMTVNQGLAASAIWGLKVDGLIPMDTYGAGEWGHKAYVKKNF